MWALILWVVVGGILALLVPPFVPTRFRSLYLTWGARLLGTLIILGALLETSIVTIPDGHVGTMFKVIGGSSLENGRIIAVNGENGPQGDLLTPGIHVIPLINIFNQVNDHQDQVVISANQIGVLSATDGAAMRPGQAIADPFPAALGYSMLDPATFFKNGGQKGTQLTVLTPGVYRLNPYLWEVKAKDAIEIPTGFVAVVKSNIMAPIDFGQLKAGLPSDCSVIKRTAVVNTESGSQQLDAPTVPVGCTGIWQTALLPGLYYVNPLAYQTTMVDTRAQIWNYAGGYNRASISLTVDDKGQIVQTRTEENVATSETDADKAINVTMEGWDIPLELRVIAQVSPDEASCVVAGVGTLAEVEDRVLTPSIRAITRDVAGGTYQVTEPKLDETAKPILDQDGKPTMVTTNRQAKALDLLYQRPLIEGEIERRIRPEAEKSCVTIREVRLGQPVMPPELLLPGRRTQLATQLTDTYKQEELAQTQRSLTEKAKANADQQTTLVTAEINVLAAKQNALAAEQVGIGQQKQLEAIAKGQQAQMAVLGEEHTVQLQMFGKVMDLLQSKPEILTTALANAQKFVPNVSISGANGGDSLGSMLMALFGQNLKTATDEPKTTPVVGAQPVAMQP